MSVSMQSFIPLATSKAGLCLTPLNWQEVQTYTLSYNLDALIFKPGMEVLKKIQDFSLYSGWSGTIPVPTVFLNASQLVANKEGGYRLRSPYDGSLFKLSYLQLLEIIQGIQPHGVLLPPHLLQEYPLLQKNWPSDIIPFFAADYGLQKQDTQALLHPDQGIYFHRDPSLPFQTFLEQLQTHSFRPRFVTGSISLEQLGCLKRKAGVEWIESDEPAARGLQGLVYSSQGDIDLTKNPDSKAFEPIDPSCLCPTCSQQLTKAYLHHLFFQTPLLAQRFLIQHNVYFSMANLSG